MKAKMNSKELIDFTYTSIPDTILREQIFGVSQLDKNDINGNYIGSMNQILILSFLSFYFKWLDKLSSSKIDSLFTSLYDKTPLTIEFIAYVLTEIQQDVQNNQHSIYKGMITGAVEYSQFSHIAEAIKIWKRSYKHTITDISLLRKMYVSLLEDLIVLRNISIKKEHQQLIYVLNDCNYDTSILLKIENNQMFYLFNTNIVDDNIIFKYVSFDERKEFEVINNKKEILKKIRKE